MRIFITLLALIITMNVSVAATSPVLNEMLDEFEYAMTVDGAALDPATAEQTILQFRDGLLALNLDQDVIIETVVARIEDKKEAAEIRSALEQIKQQNLSEEQVRAIVQDILANRTQGASWNGITELMRVFQILGIIGLTVTIVVSVLNTTKTN